MKYFSVLLRAVLVLHPQPAGPRVPQAAGQGGGWPAPGCALPLVLDKGASCLQIHTWAVPCHHTHNTALCPQGGYAEYSPLSALGSKILVTRISVTRDTWHKILSPKSVQYVVIYLWRQYFYMPWIWKQANFLFNASFYRFQSLWCSFLSEYFSLFPQSSLLPVRKAFDSLNHCLDTFFRTFQHRNIF